MKGLPAEAQARGWASEKTRAAILAALGTPPVADNLRYYTAHRLITAIATDKDIPTPFADGTYIPKLSKKPVFVMIMQFIFIGLFFSLLLTPLMTCIAHPLSNLNRLKVLVVDFDGGEVGQSFLKFMHSVAVKETQFPALDFSIAPSSTSPSDLRARVLKQQGWAAVYTSPGATERLKAAVAFGCNSTVAYNPTTAVTFAYDEGRNAQVTAPYLKGIFSAILPQYFNVFANTFIQHLPLQVVSGCLANHKQGVLIAPIASNTIDLTPTTVSYVSAMVLNLGMVYIALFGALVIVGGTYDASSPHTENMKAIPRILFRMMMMALIGASVSFALATITVGTTYYGSSGHLYSGHQWAQLFATNWVHIMVWSFGFAFLRETLGPERIPPLFTFLLVSSAIGGSSTDVSPVSYKQWYQIFPFTWAINIYRYILYGSCPDRRGISSGILIAYVCMHMCMFVPSPLFHFTIFIFHQILFRVCRAEFLLFVEERTKANGCGRGDYFTSELAR